MNNYKSTFALPCILKEFLALFFSSLILSSITPSPIRFLFPRNHESFFLKSMLLYYIELFVHALEANTPNHNDLSQ